MQKNNLIENMFKRKTLMGLQKMMAIICNCCLTSNELSSWQHVQYGADTELHVTFVEIRNQ